MVTAGGVDYNQMAQKLNEMANRNTGGTVVASTRIPGEVDRDLNVIAALNGTKKGDIIRIALQEWLERQAADKAVNSGTTTE